MGKVKAVLNMVPLEHRSPEKAVLHLMNTKPEIVPSTARLRSEMVELVRSAFTIHTTFNLGQLLQGENTPFHLQSLQAEVQKGGDEVLRFYLFSLVCIMSGIFGDRTLQGSLFLDDYNGQNIAEGIECMKHLSTSSSHAIYWSYIVKRADRLLLPT